MNTNDKQQQLTVYQSPIRALELVDEPEALPIREPHDFWKCTHVDLWSTQNKLWALGISESFLEGPVHD